MLASHNYPMYGHSPPASFLAEYTPPQSFRLYGTPRKPTLLTQRSTPSLPLKIRSPNLTPRPCLRPGAPAQSATKKRVVFADDHGYSLTQVRVMWEPSHVPPHWSLRSAPSPPLVPKAWQVTFAQPASDYVDFRKRINENNVSLENVIIKESDGFLTGTIKVKNLHYHKEVLVRWSPDNWTTSEDAFCTYVDTPAVASGAYILYDTFSFKIILPVTSNRIDFCVCFRCQDKEYWDSNSGNNYTVSRREESRSPSPPPVIAPKEYKPTLWSEYASWHSTPTDVPYW